MDTYFVCDMYYVLYFYNKVSWRKNVIKKLRRERKCIYSTFLYLSKKKKSAYKWTLTDQICIAQGSTAQRTLNNRY